MSIPLEKDAALNYLRAYWYRSGFDLDTAQAMLKLVDDNSIIEHWLPKIKKKHDNEMRGTLVAANIKTARAFTHHHRDEILAALKARDGNKCQRCGLEFPDAAYNIDHIIPLKKMGSPKEISNMRLLCEKCNKIIGDRGWRVKKES